MAKLGGGVMAFVHEDLVVKRRSDLEDDNVEVMWLEVNPHKSKKLLCVAGVYRPPSSNLDMDKQLGRNIENVKLRKGAVTLCDLSRNFAATQVASEVARCNMPRNLKVVQHFCCKKHCRK